MVLGPMSPRGLSEEWKVSGANHSGWASTNYVDSNSNTGHYYNSKSRLTPIVTDIPKEKRAASGIDISPVSPESPNDNTVAAPPP